MLQVHPTPAGYQMPHGPAVAAKAYMPVMVPNRVVVRPAAPLQPMVALPRAPVQVQRPICQAGVQTTLFGHRKPGAWEGCYSLVKTLGKGCFGTVHLVKPRDGGEERVVKEVPFKPNMPRESVLREIENMKAMDHPHVLKVFEYYESIGKICMVLEACKGGELQDLIAAHARSGLALPERFISEVMGQSLEAISYCHSKNLIHKDLKAENIMLLHQVDIAAGDRPHCIIIDLGLAEMFLPSLPRGKIYGGTKTTMAPEVMFSNFGPKCDVYSLGCILFQLLSGQLPCDPNSADMQRRLQGCRSKAQERGIFLEAKLRGPDWRLVSKASADSQELVRRMMSPQETTRPSCEEALEHRWFQMARGSSAVIPAEQLQALARYRQHSAFQRALMAKVATKMSTAQTADLVAEFKDLSRPSCGSLRTADLQTSFESLGLTPRDAETAVKALDVDGNGCVEFSEFVAACIATSGEWQKKAVKVAWHEFDTVRKGWVENSDMVKMLHLSGLVSANTDADALVRAMDSKGLGRVAFQDFHAYLEHELQLVDKAESVLSEVGQVPASESNHLAARGPVGPPGAEKASTLTLSHRRGITRS
ncbi:CPK4 [Symbiodinium microadriaticum]|nr:CPK4 [Symbiodinium microadriaticum]